MAERKSIAEVILMPLAIAFVGVLSTFVVTCQQQESAETLAAADRQVKILEIFADKITSTEEAERIFALRLLDTLDNELAAKLAHAVSENESEPPKIRRAAGQIVAEAGARASSLPRIYLHVRSEKNRTVALQIANQLNNDGYIIPGIVRLVESGPASNQLRYFRKSEESEAKKIVMSLESIGIDVVLQYIGGHENSPVIRPQHYELWFAPGELAIIEP